MTDYSTIKVGGVALPLGIYSDSAPGGTDGKLIRVSAKEINRLIHRVAPKIPITLSDCGKIHAPKPIGYVDVFWVRANELRFMGMLWSGLLPKDFDLSTMGVSLEFDDPRIHYGWMTNFRLNGLALVEKNSAAFRNTRVELCMVKT